VTIQYPEKRREVSPRFRGHPYLVEKIPGEARCVACKLCETVCPSGAISVTPASGEEMHDKRAGEYIVDLARCIYCGFCEEACPVDAVRLNRKYELSRYERGELIYDKERLLEEG
jgi:NADH-quinone oxidoreductase subunit I